jgi:hypothetical protein
MPIEPRAPTKNRGYSRGVSKTLIIVPSLPPLTSQPPSTGRGLSLGQQRALDSDKGDTSQQCLEVSPIDGIIYHCPLLHNT